MIGVPVLDFIMLQEMKRILKELAFMEAMLKPMKWDDFPSGEKTGFKLFRAPGIGWFMISFLNVFVKQLLPRMIVRKLSKEENNYYEAPFKND